jgi:hypothetical protein
VNHTDGFGVFAFAHEKLGRLEDGEGNEAEEEHDECYAAHGQDKVSPSHIFPPRTICIGLLASEVSEQRPGYEGGEHLREGPIDGKDSQEVLVSSWEEFEKDCRVDGQITAHTNRPEGSEGTNRGEVRAACCNHAKHGGYANGKVEGPPAAEDIASKAPEDGAEKQSNVLSEREELDDIRACSPSVVYERTRESLQTSGEVVEHQKYRNRSPTKRRPLSNTYSQTYRSPRRVKLVPHRRQDERRNNRPQVIHGPSKANNNEQLVGRPSANVIAVNNTATHLPLIPPHTNLLNSSIEHPSLGLIDWVQRSFF